MASVVDGIPGVIGISASDLPTPVSMPALARTRLTVGSNTADDINASQILAANFLSGNLKLFLDGVPVILFPPMLTSQPIALTTPSAAQTTQSGALVPGTYENATVVVGANGRIISVSGGTPSSGGGAGSFLIGDVVGPLSSNQLVPTGVTPGLYTNATIVVDAKGRVSFASTGTSSGITAAQHEALRQLIHFIDGGPAKGFLSGAYREINPPSAILPTTVTWWDDVTMAKKIVNKTISYTGVLPTTITWDVFDTDGTTILETIVDAIVYAGVFEINRTRTIV